MAGDNATADTGIERQATNAGDSTGSLVNNSDMQNYQAFTQAQMPERMAPDNGTLDFNYHPMQGYDNCGPDHYDPRNPWQETNNQKAGEEALKEPVKEPPSDLSASQQEQAKGFVEASREYQQLLDQRNQGGSLADDFEKTLNAYEKMQKSLEVIPDKDKDGAIAAINKELEKDNKLIARVPQTGDIYLGYKENGEIQRGPRLLKGLCQTS